MNFLDIIMAAYLLVEDTTGVAGALLQVRDQVVGVEDEVAQDTAATGGGQQLHRVAQLGQGAVGEPVGGRQAGIEGHAQVLCVEEGAGRGPAPAPRRCGVHPGEPWGAGSGQPASRKYEA